MFSTQLLCWDGDASPRKFLDPFGKGIRWNGTTPMVALGKVTRQLHQLIVNLLALNAFGNHVESHETVQTDAQTSAPG